MKILVALKQVPDSETPIKVGADGISLDLDEVKWTVDPCDENALEEALRIKETRGAEVVAVSVGGDRAVELLRKALALGADRAVLIRAAETGAPLVLAKVLAAYAQSEGFELLLLGQIGIGGDHGAVAPMLAERLGLPQVTAVTRLEWVGGGFRAERETENGTESVEGTLPALITAQRGLNVPRYPTLKGIIGARKKPLDEWKAPHVEPATRICALATAPSRPGGRRLEGDAPSQAAQLARLLQDGIRALKP